MKDFWLWVEGRPAPQGSKSYRGNNRFTEASKYLPAWRSAIVLAAKLKMSDEQDITPFDGPVAIDIQFRIQRPKNPKYNRPATPPDCDKLARGCLDALTQAKVWTDDGLVVKLTAEEFWTDEEHPISGAYIHITAL